MGLGNIRAQVAQIPGYGSHDPNIAFPLAMHRSQENQRNTNKQRENYPVNLHRRTICTVS